jgi:hypothetical protein
MINMATVNDYMSNKEVLQALKMLMMEHDIEKIKIGPIIILLSGYRQHTTDILFRISVRVPGKHWWNTKQYNMREKDMPASCKTAILRYINEYESEKEKTKKMINDVIDTYIQNSINTSMDGVKTIFRK